MQLFVVGNGFDLSHGLKTSYTDFKDYLLRRGSSIVDVLEHLVTVSPDVLWSSFEDALDSMNDEDIVDDAEDKLADQLEELDYDPLNYDGYTNSICGEYYDELKNLNILIGNWINQINLSNVISKNALNALFQGRQAFISFNYTHTLEDIYNVAPDSVFHIHGFAGSVDNKPLVGHASINDTSLCPQTGKNTITDESIAAFKDYMHADFEKFDRSSVKPTSKCINDMKHFLSGVTSSKNRLNEIIVLGHSLGACDWPYFEELDALFPNIKWTIYYHKIHNEIDGCKDEESKICKINCLSISNVSLVSDQLL